MRAVGTFIYTFVLALWVGGGVLYTFILTPAIFAAYPRNTAGDIVGAMMPHYFRYQFAVAALAAIVSLALWRLWPRWRRALGLALVIAALAVQAYVQWRLHPQILEVKSKVASFESDPDSPERRRFRSLHGRSMLLNLLTLMNGALLLVILPDRGTRAPDDRR